jgi:hypothetical protein
MYLRLLPFGGQMQYQSYKKLVSILKKRCPTAFPVSVRRVLLRNLDGDCSLVKKKFYIRINSDLPEISAIETLLHEWAHARAWNHLHDSLNNDEFHERSHDASWGVAYSEVYKIFEQYFLFSTTEHGVHCKFNIK